MAVPRRAANEQAPTRQGAPSWLRVLTSPWTPVVSTILVFVALAVALWASHALSPSLRTLMSTARESDSFALRVSAIYEIGERRAQARAAVPLLIELMRSDPDQYIRSSCAIALGKIGDPRAVPALEERLAECKRRQLGKSHLQSVEWALRELGQR